MSIADIKFNFNRLTAENIQVIQSWANDPGNAGGKLVYLFDLMIKLAVNPQPIYELPQDQARELIIHFREEFEQWALSGRRPARGIEDRSPF